MNSTENIRVKMNRGILVYLECIMQIGAFQLTRIERLLLRVSICHPSLRSTYQNAHSERCGGLRGRQMKRFTIPRIPGLHILVKSELSFNITLIESFVETKRRLPVG
jgi:hypothetical protein